MGNSIQELLLAAQTKKSPFISLLEGAATGFGRELDPARRLARLNLAEEEAAIDRKKANDAMIRQKLADQTEAGTQKALAAAGTAKTSPHPGLRLAKITADKDGYLSADIQPLEPKPAETLDGMLAEKVRKGELTIDQAFAKKNGAATPGLQYQKDKDAKKAAEDLHELQIPGYELGPTVRPLPAEAKGLRDGVAVADDFMAGIDRLGELMKKNGSTQLYGKDAGEMQTLAAQLKLQLKDVQRLGALSASDYAFLDNQITDPSSVKSLGSATGTALQQLETTKARVKSSIAAKLKAAGYSPMGGAAAPEAPAAGAPRQINRFSVAVVE